VNAACTNHRRNNSERYEEILEDEHGRRDTENIGDAGPRLYIARLGTSSVNSKHGDGWCG
jgi:hypothetical protein